MWTGGRVGPGMSVGFQGASFSLQWSPGLASSEFRAQSSPQRKADYTQDTCRSSTHRGQLTLHPAEYQAAPPQLMATPPWLFCPKKGHPDQGHPTAPLLPQDSSDTAVGLQHDTWLLKQPSLPKPGSLPSLFHSPHPL